MKKLIRLCMLLAFLCASFYLTTISYAQEDPEGDEPITMEIQPWTSITLLPWQQFNAAIKTLANNGEAVLYWTVDNNIQNFQRAEEIPAWANTWIISEDGSYPVYAWFDGWTLYYASQSETIYLNENSQQMFFNFNWIEELDLSDFDTSNVTNMWGVFAWCSSLAEINLSGWDFSKYNIASLMMNMTYGWLPSLKKLDMSNTKYGTTMNYAFWWLSSLEEIVLEWANTSVVTNMWSMFNGDSKLIELNLGGRNTSNVNNMNTMFSWCTSIKNLNLDNWDFSKNPGRWGMFMWVSSLNTLSAKNWVIPATFNSVFWCTNTQLCTQNITIDVSNWDLSRTNDLQQLFYISYAKEIKGLDTWDTSNIINMMGMFWHAMNLTWLDLNNWNTSNVTDMSYMFYESYNLQKISVKNWDVSNVTTMYYMFRDCSNLTELDLSNWDTDNLTNVSNMFAACSRLKKLDLSNWDTSKVTNVGQIFNACYQLQNLNFSWWDFRNIDAKELFLSKMTYWWLWGLKTLDMTNAKFSWSMYETFYWLSNLEKIKLNWVDTSNVTVMTNIFYGCSKLTDLDLSDFDTSNVTNMWGLVEWCNNLQELNLSGWNFTKAWSYNVISNTSSIKKLNITNAIFSWNMSYTFGWLSSLEEIKWLDTVDTSNVTNMSQMFSYCSSLTWLDLSRFNTDNVTNMWSLVQWCNNLEEINLSGRDFRKISNTSLMMNITYGWLPPLKKLNMTNTKYTWNANYAFGWLTNVEEINLEWSDVDGVTNVSKMFYWDTNLKELDLSSWDTKNVTNMSQMFYDASTLKTIYASDKFVTTNLSYNPGDMFSWTVSVVWWNWTKFDANYIDKTYAKIDKVWQTWYFTDKNAITVKFISSIDKSETTATFTKWQKLIPPSVGGYHVVWWYLDESMMQEIDLNKWVDSYSVVYVKYERNGSSGWWGGWGGWSSKPDTPKQDEQKPTETPQDDSIVSSWTNVKDPVSESETPMDSSEQAPQNDAQETNNSPANNASEWQNQQKYSTEFQQAYEFARENGITTMSTIQKADMEWKLTRIQMAKMLSQYAINILWKEPDVSKWVINFNDVTIKMNMDYDNWVTLAYQLWIMWQNMPNNKFRPNDEVSRAEFVTALSRLLYSTLDGKYESTPKYYINHMERLVKEWIITKDDPKMKELRGYVMIMLMRSAE